MATRLFEQVSDHVRRDIAAGVLRPGDKLASERELAERLKVGRPVVREALRSLEEAGILEFRRGVTGGAFIREGDSGAVTRSVTDLMFLGAITVENVFEARIILLKATAERAAMRGTAEDFAMLDNIVARTKPLFDSTADSRARVAMVGDFYGILAKAAHNDVLLVLIRSLSEMIVELLIRSPDRSLIDMVVDSRLRLMRHLHARDAEAAGKEVEDHLTRIHARIVKLAGNFDTLDLTTFLPRVDSQSTLVSR